MKKYTKKLVKGLPNMLTLTRVVLVVFFNFYIVKNFNHMMIPIVVSLVIFLTDFLDGKIARLTSSVSSAGAIFDVVTDLFYIIVSYMVLYTFHIVPLYFLFVILFKFGDFIVTSHFIKKVSNKKATFVFDYLGRIAAAIFYIIPIVSYVSFHIMPNGYFIIINSIMYIDTFIVFVSFVYRIGICIIHVQKDDLAA